MLNANLLPLLCFFIGLLAGFMSGMFGIGGGSIRTPLLVLSGIPPLSAFAINLAVVPFSSLVGALTHRKNTDIKIGAYVIVGGSLGSLAGALLVGIISRVILAILFLFNSVVIVLGMYFYKLAPRIYKRINSSL